MRDPVLCPVLVLVFIAVVSIRAPDRSGRPAPGGLILVGIPGLSHMDLASHPGSWLGRLSRTGLHGALVPAPPDFMMREFVAMVRGRTTAVPGPPPLLDWAQSHGAPAAAVAWPDASRVAFSIPGTPPSTLPAPLDEVLREDRSRISAAVKALDNGHRLVAVLLQGTGQLLSRRGTRIPEFVSVSRSYLDEVDRTLEASLGPLLGRDPVMIVSTLGIGPQLLRPGEELPELVEGVFLLAGPGIPSTSLPEPFPAPAVYAMILRLLDLPLPQGTPARPDSLVLELAGVSGAPGWETR